jgi:hypothetical protein
MRKQFGWDTPDQIRGFRDAVLCLYCENPLTLHQPDEELANRLLGTCEECKSWFITNFDGSTLVPIPDLLTDFPDLEE